MSWKEINGFHNYMVSDDGQIKSLISNKILKQNRDKDGYMTVMLYNNGTCKRMKVHRLVAEAYITPNIQGMQINHKDENPSNNHVDNLEVCTSSYNINYGNRNKTVSEKLLISSLIKRQPVEALDSDGNVVMAFPSLHDAERAGYNRSAIYQVCNKYNNGRLKTYKGMDWRYTT